MTRFCFLLPLGHIGTTPREELEGMLGKAIMDRFSVMNHHCKDESIMVALGTTRDGSDVVINRLFWEAEVKILTGTIAPHHGAGFSGGRKSVLPGLASIATLKKHHAYKMRAEQPAMGWVEGNKFHENALEVAKMAKVDFILNTVQNHRKEITQVVAGDVERPPLEGIKTSREILEITVPQPVEIVITCPGGYPKDINLWQSQKAMSAAELVVKDRGYGDPTRGMPRWAWIARLPRLHSNGGLPAGCNQPV